MTRLLLVPMASLLMIARPLLAIDIGQIKSEPNPERRAHLALDQAATDFEEAKAAYAAGNTDKTAQELRDLQGAVEVARDALAETGKDPRRHVKPFKMAETETHDLLRKLEGLEHSMDFDDRKIIEGPRARVQEVHDEWLNGIISGRR
jgi:hypothetical protein